MALKWLFRAFSCQVLKTFKAGDCITSLGNLCSCSFLLISSPYVTSCSQYLIFSPCTTVGWLWLHLLAKPFTGSGCCCPPQGLLFLRPGGCSSPGQPWQSKHTPSCLLDLPGLGQPMGQEQGMLCPLLWGVQSTTAPAEPPQRHSSTSATAGLAVSSLPCQGDGYRLRGKSPSG